MILLKLGAAALRKRSSKRVALGVAIATLGATGALAQPVTSEGDQTMMAAMRSMKTVTAQTKLTGDVDRDFMSIMILIMMPGSSCRRRRRGWASIPSLRSWPKGTSRTSARTTPGCRCFFVNGRYPLDL